MTNVPVQQWQPRGTDQSKEGPDPIEYPEFYDGITFKRVLAYVIDFLICALLAFAGWFAAAIAGVLTFGLLLAPLMASIALIPIVYHTLMIGSDKSATIGMRVCGIRVYRLDGRRPEMFQAFVQTAVFFVTAPPTSFLILIVCMFNTRRRCLHDILAGTLILNDPENAKE